jgi:hypothetical protein
MRQPPRTRAWVMVVSATAVAVSSGRAQQAVQQAVQQPAQPYTQTLQFGAGYINTPVAWVSPRNSDWWMTVSAKDLPSFEDPSKNGLASRLNSNFAIDTHWGGRVSVGASLYSQNPEWGLFGQALLIREGDFGQSFMPAFSIGARNVGRFKHEDRFLIGHDVRLDSTGQYDEFVVSRYADFKTAPTIYAVATKEVPLSGYSKNGQMSMSFSLGYGNGLFRDDGGLGDQYNNSGTIAKGLFLGSRLVMHPWSNGSVTFLAENDGWDWNVGAVAEWRGVTIGVYGTELEAGGRKGEAEGFNVYNYAKFNFSIGYYGNVRDIAHGVVLRSQVADLTRESQQLRYEIASRERRIEQLEKDLADARTGELARLEARRQQLEQQLQAERDAVKRANDRLKEIEQGRPTRPPTETPAKKPPEGR